MLTHWLNECVAITEPEGLKFLEENAKREDVTVLPSGVQYKVLRHGTGKYMGHYDAGYTFHQSGTTLSLTPDFAEKDEKDWDTFESSYHEQVGNPRDWGLRMLVKGLQESMMLMVQGDHWEIYVPTESGHGNTAGGGKKVGRNEMLIYRIEMLFVEGKRTKVKCDIKTKGRCDEEEVKLVEEFGRKSSADIDKKIKVLKNKVRLSTKPDIKEQINEQIMVLKNIKTAKAKGDEL